VPYAPGHGNRLPGSTRAAARDRRRALGTALAVLAVVAAVPLWVSVRELADRPDVDQVALQLAGGRQAACRVLQPNTWFAAAASLSVLKVAVGGPLLPVLVVFAGVLLDRRLSRRSRVRRGDGGTPEVATASELEPGTARRPDIILPPAEVGICALGGGIRSASVTLGALQALREDVLSRARYLVSVWGGGYMTGADAIQRLLVLSNVRLGIWLPNPGFPAELARLQDPEVLVPGGADPLEPGEVMERLNARLSRCAVARAGIEYPEPFSTGPGDPPSAGGILVVAKALLTPDVPYELLAYALKETAFPRQGTADQFFDHEQFDAYRALGFHIGTAAAGAVSGAHAAASTAGEREVTGQGPGGR
jgi:hypothetical protein